MVGQVGSTLLHELSKRNRNCVISRQNYQSLSLITNNVDLDQTYTRRSVLNEFSYLDSYFANL